MKGQDDMQKKDDAVTGGYSSQIAWSLIRCRVTWHLIKLHALCKEYYNYISKATTIKGLNFQCFTGYANLKTV